MRYNDRKKGEGAMMRKCMPFLSVLLLICLLLTPQAVPFVRAVDGGLSTEPETVTEPTVGELEPIDESSGVTVPTEEPPEFILGDVDQNGKVNSIDGRIVLRSAARLQELTDEEQIRADYDEDGRVNSYDARCILCVAARLDPFTEPPTPPPTTTAPPTTVAPTTKPVPPTVAPGAKRVFTRAVTDRFYTDPADAYAAVLYDYDYDKILYDHNMNARVEPASTTKLMTAYVADQYLGAGAVITVGSELDLVDWNTSRAGLYRGASMTFRELLKCLLLPSGCDAAYVIANAAGRVAANDYSLSARESVNYFVSLMNKEAQKLGMTNTRFTNPDGFPNDDRPYTTAGDMLRIGVAAYGVELIRETVKLRNASVYLSDGSYFDYFTNTNELLWPSSSRYYAYCVGMKTGSHSTAGQCLVSAATDGKRTFIAVVMRCPDKNARYRALSWLYDAAFSMPLPT